MQLNTAHYTFSNMTSGSKCTWTLMWTAMMWWIKPGLTTNRKLCFHCTYNVSSTTFCGMPIWTTTTKQKKEISTWRLRHLTFHYTTEHTFRLLKNKRQKFVKRLGSFLNFKIFLTPFCNIRQYSHRARSDVLWYVFLH